MRSTVSFNDQNRSSGSFDASFPQPPPARLTTLLNMDDLKNALRGVESGDGAGGRGKWDWEMDSSDEGSSSDSSSIGSDLLEQLMVTSDGHSYSALSPSYFLPSDPPLQAMRELQFYQMILGHYGGLLYPSRVAERIQQLLSCAGSAVLDVGCGSTALWLISMARLFPRTSLVGIDILPPAPGLLTPSNVSLEVNDISRGLPFSSSTFSLVRHSHIAQWLSKPFLEYVVHFSRVLESQGVYTFLEPEPDFELFTEDGSPLSKRFPATASFQQCHKRLASMRDFVSPSPSGAGLGHIVESSGFFRDVIEDVVLYPIGTRFGQDPSTTSVSLHILDHFLNKHRAWMPKLCDAPLATAMDLEERGRVELEGLRLCAEGTGLHIRAYSLTAIRI